MKKSLFISPLSVVAIFCFAWQALSQTEDPTKLVRPRTVARARTQQSEKNVPSPPTVQSQTKIPPPPADQEPLPILTEARPATTKLVNEAKRVLSPTSPASSAAVESRTVTAVGMLTPPLIQTRISEAKRLFKTRPQPT